MPRQRNEYDCGLFMLHYIDKFIQEAPERFTNGSLGMVQIISLHYFCCLKMLIPDTNALSGLVWTQMVQL